MPVSSEQSLFVILEAHPWVSTRIEEGTHEIELNGVKYALVEREVGFYDFLRNREKAVIGIRFSFFLRQRILKDVADLDYIYVNEQYMEIYLHGYRGSAIQGPAEQAFGDDAIWRSNLGTYALQVGTTELTGVELDVLRQYVRSSG
jgi:hypothetical protein